MRRIPTPSLAVSEGLANGMMFRIPREFCDGDHPLRLTPNEELKEWLSARNDPAFPTHRIILSWGLIIEFFDDEFKFEYMLRWSTQAEWSDL